MEITIPSKIKQKAKTQSKILGISENDFFVNAVLFYSNALSKSLELKKELRIWDDACIADYDKFEKSV